jgi:hypothetical protein
MESNPMNFVEFTRSLVRRKTDYPLPRDWPLPEPDEVLYPSRMTVTQMADHVDIPLGAFTWALACWRHHNSLTATRH